MIEKVRVVPIFYSSTPEYKADSDMDIANYSLSKPSRAEVTAQQPHLIFNMQRKDLTQYILAKSSITKKVHSSILLLVFLTIIHGSLLLNF